MSTIPTSVLLKENGERILLESGDFILLEGSYQGYAVLDEWPNWEEAPDESFSFSGTVLDNTTGLAVVKPRGDTQRQSIRVGYRFTSRAELARFRRFIDARRGRQKAFWMPTWQQDLTLTADCSTTTAVVESVGYAGRMFPYTPRKHLALINHDRVMHVCGVTAAVDGGVTETLTLDAAPAAPVIAGSSLVSFLLLVRLESDTVNYSYVSPTHMTAQISVIEVPKEVPAP